MAAVGRPLAPGAHFGGEGRNVPPTTRAQCLTGATLDLEERFRLVKIVEEELWPSRQPELSPPQPPSNFSHSPVRGISRSLSGREVNIAEDRLRLPIPAVCLHGPGPGLGHGHSHDHGHQWGFVDTPVANLVTGGVVNAGRGTPVVSMGMLPRQQPPPSTPLPPPPPPTHQCASQVPDATIPLLHWHPLHVAPVLQMFQHPGHQVHLHHQPEVSLGREHSTNQGGAQHGPSPCLQERRQGQSSIQGLGGGQAQRGAENWFVGGLHQGTGPTIRRFFHGPLGLGLYTFPLSALQLSPQHFPLYTIDPRHMPSRQPPTSPQSAPAPGGGAGTVPSVNSLNLGCRSGLFVDLRVTGKRDNREEVSSQAWRLEKKRRREGRTTCHIDVFQELQVGNESTEVDANAAFTAGDKDVGSWGYHWEGAGENGRAGLRDKPPPGFRDHFCLASSIGIVTDLVLPGRRASVDFEGLGEASGVGGEEEDDEDRALGEYLEVMYARSRENLKAHAQAEFQQAHRREAIPWLTSRSPQEKLAYHHRNYCQ
ncbi:unnamed protein product [Choristocarpus tenellus]